MRNMFRSRLEKTLRGLASDLAEASSANNRLMAVCGMSVEEITDAFIKGYRLMSPKAVKDDIPDGMTLDEVIKNEEEVADSHHRIMKVRAITEYDLISANYHRQLAEWLKELKQLREQTSWIPVTKRLPDDYDRHLISTDDGMVEIANYGYTHDGPNEIAFYQWNDEECQCWKPDVTAWMPLPEPYKEGSEK